MESFGIFGLAFLCRPVGGVLLGYIGDVYGRKRALEISIFLMAFPTFAMGCLPSYAQVGNLSMVLLALIRMLQGMSVGGQFVSSLVYTCENNPRDQWGFYGACVNASSNLGFLLGGLISYLIRATLSEESLKSWGWRLPFLSGIVLSFCGLYLKYYCEDDTIEGRHGSSGTEGGRSHAENPIRAAFRKENRRALLAAALVPMLSSAGFYIVFVWLATFMGALMDPPIPNAFGINSASLFLTVCLLYPFVGMLSDKVGRYKIMVVGGLAMMVLTPFMVLIISRGDAIGALFAQCVLGVSFTCFSAPSK